MSTKSTKKKSTKSTKAKKPASRVLTGNACRADEAALEAEASELGKALPATVEQSSSDTAPSTVRRQAAPRKRGESVTATAEELIIAGKTDEEIMEQLIKEYGIDPKTKSHYPGWYRRRLVRTGKITEKFAMEHKHAKKEEAS